MNPHYARVADRAEHRCEYCRAPEVSFNFPFEVEHIVPTGRGGSDDEANLALSCRSCNIRKAAHLGAIDPESGLESRLFHPREDLWSEHFGFDLERGAILGRTAIGRATLARLALNGQTQVAARRQWMRLGLFP